MKAKRVEIQKYESLSFTDLDSKRATIDDALAGAINNHASEIEKIKKKLGI